ncbi:efflux RND transporter periplasmic adaptor subunit [Butyrivibrio sp. XPD2006]|uniref:efflux RND transporter periplasmic adaptor subunit n=1 Tax=Butyrivibrio sp. XPD2006 TaxID=1280668 RepID=UPI0003B42CDF|nr:efflux RND transporter periplasmic adaptor subunit [Butyrivibrio sp. XPD2006]
MSENKNKNKDIQNETVEKEVVQNTESAVTAAPEVSNEIKETTGVDMEVYDDYDATDLADSVKKKKRFKKRYVVLGVVALIIAAYIIYSLNAAKNAVVMVETQDVALGTIENVLSISGTVQSGETKNYYSDVTAPIASLNVKVGDKVSEGDELFSYDTEALDLAQKNAELAIKQAKGNYNALYSPVGTADRKYAEGMSAQQINDRIDAITAEIDALNNKITEKKNRISQTLTDLQKTAMDINQNGVADGTLGDNDYLNRRENDNNNSDMSESNRQMSLAVQQSIQDVTYALNNDPEMQEWSNQITALKEEQTHLSSAKAAQVNPGSASASKATLESTQLTQEDTISKIEAAKEGIKAEFDGVVTAIPATVAEGATVATGTQILTMANLEDVQVTIQVSKSDLPKISMGQKVDITINGKPYNGEITKISGNATKNANGVAVVDTVIKVLNPDSDIIFGVEANNKIHAQKADNTIVLPYEYVQTDSTGDYVYVLAADGTVQRKDVVIGISTSTDAQITEGLEVGDKVITSDVSTLTEGMAVVEMPVQ